MRTQIQANAESVLNKHSLSIPIPSQRDSLGDAGSQMIQSAGRPVRSIRSKPIDQFITPNEIQVGKRVYPTTPTIGQYISEEDAYNARMRGGKRVDMPLMIKPKNVGGLQPNANMMGEVLGTPPSSVPSHRQDVAQYANSMPQAVSHQL